MDGISTFFTVDRCGSLREGLELQLQQYPVNVDASAGPSLSDLPQHVRDLFPDGLSVHGKQYLIDRRLDRDASLREVGDPLTELVFEYVRRLEFAHQPSRFQSIFAVESLQDAIAFRDRFGRPNDAVWEIESEHCFRADMNLVGNGNSILAYSFFANTYWRGEPGPSPVWEVLLSPPVRVVRKVM